MQTRQKEQQKTVFANLLIVAVAFALFVQVTVGHAADICLDHFSVIEGIAHSNMDKPDSDCAKKDEASEKQNNSENQSSISLNHAYCASHCCPTGVSGVFNYKMPYELLKEVVVFSYKASSTSYSFFGILRPPRLIV